jgi:CheY-like chemotaxis protein
MVSKYKSDFLANMSHELRTPLNSLLVLAKVLTENKDENLGERELEYARTIYGSGTDLLRLINEVLDLSKLEAGKFQIEPREFELKEIADVLAKNFRPLAEDKALDLFIEMAPELPAVMHTDRERLEQILRNLLSNALKFTERGWVRLKIELAQLPETADGETLGGSECVIAFSVIDTGIGIAPEKQKLIFEAFQQAGSGTSRKYGGTGLGLSISREIAGALNGTIAVRSTPGRGSIFTLYLPVEYRPAHRPPGEHETSNGNHLGPPAKSAATDSRARQAAPAIASLSEGNRIAFPKAELSDKKVLIVDDDKRNTFATRVLLESYGMAVLEADNGVDAIALVDRNPDLALVLMDIMMPELDGYQTIERIRSSAQNRVVPIIAVTAKAFKEDRERCIEAGASDYVAKPVDEDELIDIIRSWVSTRAKNGEVPR